MVVNGEVAISGSLASIAIRWLIVADKTAVDDVAKDTSCRDVATVDEGVVAAAEDGRSASCRV